MIKNSAVIICSLFLTLSFLSFTKENRDSDPNVVVIEHADRNLNFEQGQNLFNNETNVYNETLEEEVQDKGEGQIKIKF